MEAIRDQDYDWAGEQQEMAYWEAQKYLTLLYGPQYIPQDFYEFVEWMDRRATNG